MKVGDYIRTDKGEIGKVISIANDNDFGLGKEYSGSVAFNTEPYVYGDIIKISPNIIDLIEVGDYVNGYKVTMLEDEYYDDATDSVKKIKDKEKIKIILGNEEQFYGIYAKDIKSIVTKEQFEAMKYEIK